MKKILSRAYSSWWFWPLALAVVLRVILSVTTFHPDLWAHSYSTYFFAYEGQLNIYEFFATLPQTHPLIRAIGVTDTFIYPPLTYFTIGIFRVLVKPFDDAGFIPMLWSGNAIALAYPLLHLHLFLYKIPYLFIDILGAFFFSKLFEEKKRRIAFALWLFNPLSLYATYMMGQFEILPIFFSVLTLYLAKKRRFGWAMACLGIGASYKMYPLLFVPAAAFLFSESLKTRVKYLALGVAPFLATILPYLGSPAFRQMVLFAPKSQKMLYMGFPVSGAEVIYPFMVLLGLIYLHSYYAKTKLSLGAYFLTISLLILAVTHYHPQWFFWATPFLLWYLILNNFRHLGIVLGLFACWLGITLFFEASLSYGLFNPVLPSLSEAAGLSEIVGKFTNVFQLKSIFRSLFFAGSAYIAISLFRSPAKN
jgi:hypothetical protein